MSKLKRFFDPLVCGPLLGMGYFWYAIGWKAETPIVLGQSAVTLFFGWFALMNWRDSKPNSQQSETSDRIWSLVLGGVVIAMFIAVAGFLSYLFFVELPKMDLPWFVKLIFQGFLLVVFGAIGGTAGWDYLKKRKGQILIVEDAPFYVPGETIHGAVQIKLRRDTEVQAVYLSLLGLTKHRRTTGTNGATYIDETVHYERRIPLPVNAGTMSGEQNFVEFDIDLEEEKIAELVDGRMDLHWCLQANMQCSGIDLDGRRWIEIVSEDEVNYEGADDDEADAQS